MTDLPKQDAQRIIEALMQVTVDPFARHGFAKPLQREEAYRVRKGDWRAVCEIDRAAQVVRVVRVAKRRRVYR